MRFLHLGLIAGITGALLLAGCAKPTTGSTQGSRPSTGTGRTIFQFEQSAFCTLMHCRESENFISYNGYIEHTYQVNRTGCRVRAFSRNTVVIYTEIQCPVDQGRSPEFSDSVVALLSFVEHRLDGRSLVRDLLLNPIPEVTDSEPPRRRFGEYFADSKVFESNGRAIQRIAFQRADAFGGETAEEVSSASLPLPIAFAGCTCDRSTQYWGPLGHDGAFAIHGTVATRVWRDHQQVGLLIDLSVTNITPLREWTRWASIPLSETRYGGNKFFFPLGQLENGVVTTVATVSGPIQEKLLSALATHEPIILIVSAPKCPSPPRESSPSFTPVCFMQ